MPNIRAAITDFVIAWAVASVKEGSPERDLRRKSLAEGLGKRPTARGGSQRGNVRYGANDA
jgi:hypothetical protein